MDKVQCKPDLLFFFAARRYLFQDMRQRSHSIHDPNYRQITPAHGFGVPQWNGNECRCAAMISTVPKKLKKFLRK